MYQPSDYVHRNVGKIMDSGIEMIGEASHIVMC